MYRRLLGSSLVIVAKVLLITTSHHSQDKPVRLVNKVPKHLPISVEIIKGDSDELLRDVRVKVTNIGEKPIYYLMFFISTPESFRSTKGNQYGFPLKFGRNELVTFTERAAPDDVSIKNSESQIFEVDGNQVRNFREMLTQTLRSEPEIYILEFQFLSFGDGTGFWGATGAAFPSKRRQISLLNEFTSFDSGSAFFFRIAV